MTVFKASRSLAQSVSNATLHKHWPLTGLFAVNKPANLTSTTILDYLQRVCRRNKDHPFVKQVLEVDGSKRARRGLVKIGHGGTLDPLARGIVVVGMGSGCKKLHNMSGSSKVYIAEARLGFSSSTLDSTGSLEDHAPTDHITKDSLLQALQAFKGEITQTPPKYSALHMDGKRLYDYAREGIPLPRDIPTRKVHIFGLDLLTFPDGSTEPHPAVKQFGFRAENALATGSLPEAMQATVRSFKDGFVPKPTGSFEPNHVPIPSEPQGLFFHIRVHCSSGTYIRTLIADIASHLGTVGHMTDLLRVEQSGFRLGDESTLEMSDCESIERIDEAIQAGNRIWEIRERKEASAAA